MRIEVDLDEILADYLSAVIEFHNKKYHTALKKSDFFSYRFWEVWGGNREEAIQKVYDFYQTPEFKNVQPVAGAIEAIKKLKENHDLFIITSRTDDLLAETKEWIDKHFKDLFAQIVLTNHYSQTGESRKKSDFCDSLQIDIFIDDSPEYAQECFDGKRKVFLFDYPWNQDLNMPGITRVSGWAEALKMIDSGHF